MKRIIVLLFMLSSLASKAQRTSAWNHQLNEAAVSSAVFSDGSGIIFSGGTDGNLHACYFHDQSWTWKKFKPDTRINLVGKPQLILKSKEEAFVFTRTHQNRLMLLLPNKRIPEWINLGAPKSGSNEITLLSDPVSVNLNNVIHTFIIGEDGILYRHILKGKEGTWEPLNAPDFRLIGEVSILVSYNKNRTSPPVVEIYAIDGKSQALRLTLNETNNNWDVIGQPKNSRGAAVTLVGGLSVVNSKDTGKFVFATDNRGQMYTATNDTGNWTWEIINNPSGVKLLPGTSAMKDAAGQPGVFAVDQAGGLHKCFQNSRTQGWDWVTYHPRKSGTTFSSAPSTFLVNKTLFNAIKGKNGELFISYYGKGDWQLLGLGKGKENYQEAEVWLPRTNKKSRIRYTEKVGKYLLYQGDILIDPNWKPAFAQEENAESAGVQLKSFSLWESDCFWSGGIVPYEIDSHFSSSYVQKIISAINHLGGKTNLKFVHRKGNENHNDYIYFEKQDDDFCSSCVGHQGGRQAIMLNPEKCTVGAIVHEMMHAVGFYHEQSRPDRDQYVTILWGNIMDGKESNFDIEDSENIRWSSYDYRSIMHYCKTCFGKMYFDFSSPDKSVEVKMKQTIIPKQQNVTLGGSELSEMDIMAVNRAYAKVGAKPVKPKFESSVKKFAQGKKILVMTPEDVLLNPGFTTMFVWAKPYDTQFIELKQLNKSAWIKWSYESDLGQTKKKVLEVPAKTITLGVTYFDKLEEVVFTFFQ